MAVVSSTSSAAARASPGRRWRAKAPTITFWRTVMLPNGLTSWKVRQRPRRQRRSGARSVTVRSWKRISPASGLMKPVTSEKSVVFPAPLGPITPTISPSSTSKLMSRTAERPPNRFETPRTSRSDAMVRQPAPPAGG